MKQKDFEKEDDKEASHRHSRKKVHYCAEEAPVAAERPPVSLARGSTSDYRPDARGSTSDFHRFDARGSKSDYRSDARGSTSGYRSDAHGSTNYRSAAHGSTDYPAAPSVSFARGTGRQEDHRPASHNANMKGKKKVQRFETEEQEVELVPPIRTQKVDPVTTKATTRPTTTTQAAPPQRNSGVVEPQPGAHQIGYRHDEDTNVNDSDTIVFEPPLADDEECSDGRGRTNQRRTDIPPAPRTEGLPLKYSHGELDEGMQIAFADVAKFPKTIEEAEKGGTYATLDEEEEEDEGRRCNKKKWIVSVVVHLLVLTAATTIGVIISGNKCCGPSARTKEDYINLIQSHSPSTSFEDPSSPQQLTLDWMMQDATAAEIRDDNRILQRFAVGTLQLAFGLDLWAERSSDECDWRGMGCSGTTGVVDWINFFSQSLVGTVPREIGLLTALMWLDLSFNNGLSGWLPSELSKLENLSSLFLSDTALTGSIPSNLCGQLEQAEIDCGDIVCDCCQCE